ncbi:acetyl-CoA hydrolase/transferase family protein [Streptomyces sp. NPDC057199]|uniref:acetyl-CoA hydrolase/transferase family protein n=1 Tax=Streptomyces sp. NPDC057199 TaxID=3346047 RepID=UPI00363F22DC
MIDLSPFVRPGSGVWWSQASAEPTPLVHALLDQADALGPVRAFSGLSWDDRLARHLPQSVTLSSYGALGELRLLSRAGRLDIVPCHYSALPRLFAEGALPSDVGFVQVSPPDADGTCSLGVGVDYISDALAHTPVLIAEVNRRMPTTTGTARIPLSRFAAVVETDRPLAQAPVRAADDVELAIARHVAELVEDGDTLQLGVGSLPTAVLDRLAGHQDLGFHAGMISDGVLRLVEKGVLTGARKEIDPGVIVTGAALGSTELYERLPELPVEFRPASYTHAPHVLSRLRTLVSVNSAIDVDLTGQVGAESRRGVHIGAVGGQVDFSRAAALTGARSIITVRARSGEHSTIVSRLHGPVTTGRSDVDHVVTEYGAAHLRGCDLTERTRRLAAIAAPEFREDLLNGAK